MSIYTKVCTKCKVEKSVSDFGKHKITKDGLSYNCKQCYANYRKLNSASISEYFHKYRQENKQRINFQQNLYQQNKRKTDRLHDLVTRIRIRIVESLSTNGYTKKSRTHEILGCSYDEFRIHIENQFVEGMSWDNRSEWHLDHITPVSWGKNEEEIIALNHYTNFQPLWAKDNIRKGNKFSG